MEALHIVFIAFLVVFGLQAFYFLFFYLRLVFYKHPPTLQQLPPLSVIICARNEEKNLINNLPAILEQDYSNFEVIVVDDCSWDDTQDVLGAIQVKHPNLKIVTMQENDLFEGGKKYAVSLGLKAASHECVVLTDADCVPASNKWLQHMASGFGDAKKVVLGYGAYRKTKGLLNSLIRFDTFMIAVQYLSYALAGFPYMGVGRNLAYRKELFFGVKGFAKHMHIASGDDDLFINQVATGKNTTLVFEPEAHTISQPPATLMAWVRQKRRHLTTAGHYRSVHKFLLGLWSFSYYLFLALSAILLIFQYELYIVLALAGARILLQWLVLLLPAKKLLSISLLIFAPLLELLLMLIYPIFAIRKSGGNKRKWTR